MKYELGTIPVWDAIREDTECHLCHLYETSREYYLGFYLGASVMNPETRVRVNKGGFCPSHYTDMVAKRKSHALGLMTHTYLQEYQKILHPAMENLQKKAKTAGKKSLLPLVPKDVLKAQSDLCELIQIREKSCLICDDLKHRMDQYYYTTAYLWKNDKDFRAALNSSKGICIHHMEGLLPLAKEALSPTLLMNFLDELMELQKKNLNRIEEELRWFTQKFDSQNNSKPWGDSKNAHKRTVQKLTGLEFELDYVPDI